MIEHTATELLRSLQQGEVSSESLVQQFLQAIRERDSQIQAFLSVDEDGALEQARNVDLRRKKNEPLGPLAGLPIALKDNFCVQGALTTCASKILPTFIPPYDAHVVTLLKQADAVLVGKTNLDEFAMGSSTENSGLQITHHPWNLECSPGGSSGGSAAAVAAS